MATYGRWQIRLGQEVGEEAVGESLFRHKVFLSQWQLMGDGKSALGKPFLFVAEANQALGVAPQIANESLIIPDVETIRIKHGLLPLVRTTAWAPQPCAAG